MAVAPKNLVLQGKADAKAPGWWKIDARTIEQWCNNLKTGGTYASLTGAGQTASPGSLTQNGGFIISDNTGEGIIISENGGGINITEHGSGGTVISDNGGGMTISETNGGAMTISDDDTTGSGLVIEQVGGASSGGIDIHTNNTSPSAGVNLCHSLDLLSFFQNGGDPLQNVTGSRGGNVALANLLTALANYGLISDSTTP